MWQCGNDGIWNGYYITQKNGLIIYSLENYCAADTVLFQFGWKLRKRIAFTLNIINDEEPYQGNRLS
jgi:hypothetical protein